jgi:hypothetical protein
VTTVELRVGEALDGTPAVTTHQDSPEAGWAHPGLGQEHVCAATVAVATE